MCYHNTAPMTHTKPLRIPAVHQINPTNQNHRDLLKFTIVRSIFTKQNCKDVHLGLSKSKNQRYWKEEIPVIPIGPMVLGRKGWVRSGRFERGDEYVEYIARLDTYVCWVRYRGDQRLYSGWQSVLLNQRFSMSEGRIWSGTCPFCCTNTRRLLFYERSIRCRSCLKLTSRWGKQLAATLPYRSAIRSGALSKVMEGLRGSPREMQMAMIAMELTGLSPKKLSSPRNLGPWVQVKNRSIF